AATARRRDYALLAVPCALLRSRGQISRGRTPLSTRAAAARAPAAPASPAAPAGRRGCARVALDRAAHQLHGVDARLDDVLQRCLGALIGHAAVAVGDGS